jgi:transcriptional regulator GlxA family with amidase domain
MRYLAKVRLAQAAGYLRTADLSIDAIAMRTGYGNNASLSKAFKRELGISPGAYRRSRDEAASSAGLIAVDILTRPMPGQAVWPPGRIN